MGYSPEEIPVKRTLISWSLEGGKGLLACLLIASLLLSFVRLLPLEFQKRIVNNAIKEKDLPLLYLYCSGFILSVLANMGLKYGIQFFQSLVGERILVTMRNAFFSHALTLPWTFFHHHGSGKISTLLVNHLGPVGDYLGNAWTVPLSNILTLIMVGGYLAWINPLLALVSLSVYPLALVFLPRIQAFANRANEKRLAFAQQLGGRISETFSGIGDIQGHSGYAIEADLFSDLTNRQKKARIRWRLSKLGGKAFNNLFINLSPFFVFLVGGVYAMEGSLDMGELVAFLSAQSMLFSPWTELMGHYHLQQDAAVQYKKVQEFFDVPPAQSSGFSQAKPRQITGHFQVKGLRLDSLDNVRLLDRIDLDVAPGELVAIVGRSGSGKSLLLSCMAGKIRDYQGRILVDGKDLADQNGPDLAPFFGIVSQFPYLSLGTVRENLLYPVQALGAGELPDMDHMILAVQQAGLYSDILLLGLNQIPDQALYEKFGTELEKMQAIVRSDLPTELAAQIRFFTTPPDPGRHPLLEIILGGRPADRDACGLMAWLPRIVPLLMEYDLLETIVEAGFSFNIGIRGERLSGGQRRRLALAAVLLKKPAVLLLDEAGSGLDPASRSRLTRLLNTLKGDTTILSAVHNLEHIRDYDRICVIHQGRIVESGTYDRLMAQEGWFFKMVTKPAEI